MKNIISKSAVLILMLFASASAFSQQDPKSEKARKNEAKAQNKINLAKTDSAADFQKFKTESEAKIEENKKQIAILKQKKVTGSEAANKKYDKDVLALQLKNNELKKKIDNADDTPTSGWIAFKRAFNNSMDDLGCAMKNVGSCEK
jgi:hypothetical protein